MKITCYNDKEIEGIREASILAARTLDMIGEFVKVGITTMELDLLIQKFIESHGGVCALLGYRGYPRVSCISVNHVVCHGIPSEKFFLKEGDMLNIDVTVKTGRFFW